MLQQNNSISACTPKDINSHSRAHKAMEEIQFEIYGNFRLSFSIQQE